MVKMRHGLATLSCNDVVFYGQKHKVWVPFSKLVRAEHFGEIYCFATKPHRLQQLHSRNAAKYFIKWVG